MKKILLAVFICFLWTVSAHATPYLVCDPQEGVTEYEIVDNGATLPMVAAQADGSLRYDLAGIEKGEHSYQVKACNMWGCSDPSGIVIIKTVPTAPVLKIEIEK